MVAALGVFLIFLPSYAQMQDLRQKNIDFARKIQQLRFDNARLKEQRSRLENDPIYLEKVAREKMGLIRENEMVYRIVPEEQPQQSK